MRPRQRGKGSAAGGGEGPSRLRDRALGAASAHRRELVLVVQTHRSRGKLVFGNDLATERPAVLGVTCRAAVRCERRWGLISGLGPGPRLAWNGAHPGPRGPLTWDGGGYRRTRPGYRRGVRLR